jgi:hypothetical protein
VLIREAEWIAAQLGRVPDRELSPLLNLGSSTEDFGTRQQPHVSQLVFEPLRRRGTRVVNVDVKREAGVDIVGDICEPAVAQRVREAGVRAALVSNLLEHVPDPAAMARAVLDVVPAGGVIVVTGPRRFPYHPDPIDNRFRPDAAQAAELFPGATVLETATIDAGSWREWDPRERAGRTRTRPIVRSLVPFYRPGNWLDAVRQLPYLVRSAQAFGLVMRKEGDGR